MFSLLKSSNDIFIIAEVGQNHQGDLDLALQYIREFASAGADAIKFQTRNNKFLFSKEAYEKNYDSENSFGKTYGEHRDFLEFSQKEILILKEECLKSKVKFMSTPFDELSLDLLCNIGVDAIKVASFDIGNLAFLNKIAKSKLPIVMSTGGAKDDQIKSSVDLISKTHKNLALLHCVSEYPCPPEKMSLSKLSDLKTNFKDITIGSSDHFNGILSGPLAYMLGARVFEKHVTLDRSWKGSDHSFALSKHGFSQFVRDIKRTPIMLKNQLKSDLGEERVFQKLGKSLVASIDLKKGSKLTLDNVTGKIFVNTYIPVRESSSIIGQRLNTSKKAGQPILEEDIIK